MTTTIDMCLEFPTNSTVTYVYKTGMMTSLSHLILVVSSSSLSSTSKHGGTAKRVKQSRNTKRRKTRECYKITSKNKQTNAQKNRRKKAGMILDI